MSETIIANNVTFLFGDGAEQSELTSLIYLGAPCELSELGFRFEPANPSEQDWQGDPKAVIDKDKMSLDIAVTMITSRGAYPLEASPSLAIPVIALWSDVDGYPYILSENERLASAPFKDGKVLLVDPLEELSISLRRDVSKGCFSGMFALRATIYGERVL